MTRSATIFDLDGTLIDSESLAHVAWGRTLRHFGRVFKPEHESLMLGWQLSEALENIKRHFELDVSVETLFGVLSEEWADLTKNGLPTMPGVGALLDSLDQRGIPWGVATNSDHAYATQHLTHVNLVSRAQAIVGCDDVPNAKPAPDVFLACAKLMDVAPNACIAVEDSKVGHRAAAAAGMLVVVVFEGATSAEFPQADHIFHSHQQFLKNLDTLLSA
ncbi:MAG: HAD family hydrolase [Candidatus Promineifilaceae bacterium]